MSDEHKPRAFHREVNQQAPYFSTPYGKYEVPANVLADRRRASRRKGGMAKLDELLPRIFPKAEPEDAILFRVMAFWERAMPHRMVKNARPVTLRKGVLTIHTTTSAWAQEVQLRVTEILERMSRGVPKARVVSMRAKAGPLPERIIPKPREELRVVPIAKLPMALEVALENIEDVRLRAVLERAAKLSLGTVIKKPPDESLP